MERVYHVFGEGQRLSIGLSDSDKLYKQYHNKTTKNITFLHCSKKCRIGTLIFISAVSFFSTCIYFISYSSSNHSFQDAFWNSHKVKTSKNLNSCPNSPKVLESIHFNDNSPNSTIITNEELFNLKRHGWSSPIVVEKYKLLFIQIEKVGCTQWKRLLQLIQNISSPEKTSIHDPQRNGLKYLTSYDDLQPRLMILNSSWTKATMVREPRARILSAYLNVMSDRYFERYLSLKNPTFRQFLFYISSHSNEHWSSQIRFPLWAYRNVMVGKIENIQEFGEKVLKRIGAWDKWGHKWGKFKNETIFSDMYGHTALKEKANRRLKEYYTRELEDVVFHLYRQEYILFNYSCNYISLH